MTDYFYPDPNNPWLAFQNCTFIDNLAAGDHVFFAAGVEIVGTVFVDLDAEDEAETP